MRKAQRLRLLCFLLCVSISASVAAQTAEGEVLTNAHVVELKKFGLSDPLIIQKIETTPCTFELTVADLGALKKAGLSDAVLGAMMKRGSASGAPAENATPALATREASDLLQDDATAGEVADQAGVPTVPVEPGVYLVVPGESSLLQLEPSSVEMKTGGLWKSAFSFGAAKVKAKAVVRGPRARTRTDEARPVFYFYFGQAALDQSSTIVSPNEAILVKADVNEENDREFIVASANISGAKSGVQDRFLVPFDFEKVGPGYYRVFPTKDLKSGEYCFTYGGGSGTLRVYDWGVDG